MKTKKESNPYIMKKCGQRVRECLEEKGISQAKLAEEIGYTQQHISYVINGKRALSREMAEAIIEVLNADPKKYSMNVHMPYYELDKDERDSYVDEIDEDGWVNVWVDFPYLYRTDYLLCESDIKINDYSKDYDDFLGKAVIEVLSELGYDLTIGVKYNCYMGILKSSFSFDDKKHKKSSIVRRKDGKEILFTPLEITELFKDYISAIKSHTERLFERQDQLDCIKRAKEEEEKRNAEFMKELPFS